MPLPVGTIVAGAIGTAIGAFFQDRSAKIQQERAQRLAELQKADALFHEIFDSLDAAMYLNQEAMWLSVFGRQEADAPLGPLSVWQKYQGALAQWKTGQARRVAEVANYFGSDVGKSIESIQRGFRRYENMVDATYYKRTRSRYYLEDKKGSKNDFRTKYFDGRDESRKLDREYRALAKTMSGLLQEQKVGIFHPQRKEELALQAAREEELALQAAKKKS